MKLYLLVFFCFALTMLSAIAINNAYALDIKDIRFGKHPDKIRIVLDLSEVADFRVFILQSPMRMVIDLPAFKWQAGQVSKQNEAMISDIRQGRLTPNISRVVFDLSQPITINSAFILPKQGNKENRLVIDYSVASLKEFKNQKGIIHGNLKIDNYKESSILEKKKTPTPPKNNSRPNHKKPLIIIDAGHGGVDPGTVGTYKNYEKNIALAMAKELKRQLLASKKYRVLLTREKDVFIRLKNRVAFARKHQGDLFISLHVNSNKDRRTHGISIYTLSKKASDAQAAKLAEKENQADLMSGINFDVEDEQVAFILGDFLMNDTMNQSKFLANILVQNAKKHGIRTLHNTHRYAGFAVLKAPDIPSVLIETGFLSNKKEAKLLNNRAYRKKISNSILKGINEYFRVRAY